MKIPATIIIGLSLLVIARADTSGREALVAEITQLTGVDEMVREAKKAMTQQANDATGQMFEQIRTGMPGLPKETWAAIQAAAEKMVRKVDASWNADEAIRVWQAEYTADFTESELREMIASAKTPLGRKQVAVGKRANAVLQKFLMERAKTALEAGVSDYVAELQRIVASVSGGVPPDAK